MNLTPEQLMRYSRHFILPEVGEEGQKKLLKSKVLLIGTGGLGSPLGLYLAAAGVGTLGLVDFDTVDLSNLQRQIIHTNDDIGKPKIESAERRIKAMNPDTKVVKYPVRLSSANAMDILKEVEGLEIIRLQQSDVIRHSLVKKIIDAFDKAEAKEKELRAEDDH